MKPTPTPTQSGWLNTQQLRSSRWRSLVLLTLGMLALGGASLGASLIAPSQAFAQAPAVDWEVSAYVNHPTAKLREPLEFRIELIGFGPQSPQLISEPSLHGFSVTHKSGLVTSIEPRQGRVAKRHQFTFSISPRNTGTLTIGAAKIEIGGKTILTEPVQVEVHGSASGGTAWSPPNVAPTPSKQPPKPQRAKITLPGEEFFIEARTLKNEVFLGEPLFLRYDLFRSERIARGFYLNRDPQIQGFWPHDATSENEDTSFGAGDERRDGIQYDRELLQALILIPLETGKLDLAPMELEVHNGGGGGKRWISSPPSSILVKELPSGAPKNFDIRNVVSELTLTEDKVDVDTGAELDKMRRGDLLNITLNVLAEGSVSHVRLAPLELNKDLHYYALDVESSKDQVYGQMLRGKKVFKLQVAALTEGKIEVPAVRITYFDFKDKTYHEASAGPWTITVSGAAPNFDSILALSKENKEDQVSILKVISGLPGVRSASLNAPSKGKPPLYQNLWFLLLLAAAPGVFAGLILREKFQTIRVKEAPTRRVKGSAKQAHKALSKLTKNFDSEDNNTLYTALVEILRSYLDDRLELKTKGMSSAKLRETLQQRRCPKETVERLLTLFSDAGSIRYAPDDAFDSTRRRTDLRAAEEIIEALDTHFNASTSEAN